MNKTKLNIQSIFHSIDGESNGFYGAGQPCTFIRLKGCNLKCVWCLTGSSLISVVNKNHKVSKKKIKDVKVGQKILSFDFNQNKLVETVVTTIFSREVPKEDILKIEINGGSNYNKLYVTKEHPFFVRGRWVRAEELKVGDELYMLPRSLINKFSARHRNKEFHKIIAKKLRGRPKTAKQIEQYRILAQKREDNMSVEQKRSRAMKGYITRGQWGRLTGCEKYFIELLNNSKLPVKFVGNGKLWIGKKNPDFVVTGQKKVIEVTDKTATFRNFETYKQTRTVHFEKYGYKCLVLSIPQYPSRGEVKKKLLSTISAFIMNGKKVTSISAISSKQVARIGLNCRKGEGRGSKDKIKVYNVECSEHHNYFINGVLSHNCDTQYSQNSEPPNWMTIEEVVDQIKYPKLTITGGEPLLQLDGVYKLVSYLLHTYKEHANSWRFSIETNGTIEPKVFPPEVRYVMDWKLTSSGMNQEMNLDAFTHLRPQDVIKFVISDWNDYKEALDTIQQHPEWKAMNVFSPAISYETLYNGYSDDIGELVVDMSWPRLLVERMLSDGLNIQFSLQLHKLIWPGATGEC